MIKELHIKYPISEQGINKLNRQINFFCQLTSIEILIHDRYKIIETALKFSNIRMITAESALYIILQSVSH